MIIKTQEGRNYLREDTDEDCSTLQPEFEIPETVFAAIDGAARFQQKSLSRSSTKFRSRSHSPLRSPISSSYSSKRVDTLCHSRRSSAQDDEIEMQGFDCKRIEKISRNIDDCCNKILNSDRLLISNLLETTKKDFIAFGYLLSQLWLFEPGIGLSFQGKGSAAIDLPSKRLATIFSDIDIIANKEGDYPTTNKSGCRSRIRIIRPEDLSWYDMISLIRSAAPKCTENTRILEWKAIHIIPILIVSSNVGSDCISISKAGSGSASGSESGQGDHFVGDVADGFIFAVEIDSTISKAVTRRANNINVSRVRTVLSTQYFKQIAAAIGRRLSELDGINNFTNFTNQNKKIAHTTTTKENVRVKSQLDNFYSEICRQKKRNCISQFFLTWKHLTFKNKIENLKTKKKEMEDIILLHERNERESKQQISKSKNTIDRLSVRSCCTHELALFSSKMMEISRLNDLGDHINDCVPKIFNIQKVVFLKKHENEKFQEGKIASVHFLPILSTNRLQGSNKIKCASVLLFILLFHL